MILAHRKHTICQVLTLSLVCLVAKAIPASVARVSKGVRLNHLVEGSSRTYTTW